MRLDELRTGVRAEPPPQDAQEVGEVPLSVTELLAALRSDEPLDLYDLELAFTSLADNYNNAACFTTATEYAVRAVSGDPDVPVYISATVRAAMTSPVRVAGPDAYDEFSHVIPAMERCCRALEAGVVDRRPFAADVEELAIQYYMADIRAMAAVCRYLDAALPSLWRDKAVPPLGDFPLDGIPAARYRALGAALVKALE